MIEPSSHCTDSSAVTSSRYRVGSEADSPLFSSLTTIASTPARSYSPRMRGPDVCRRPISLRPAPCRARNCGSLGRMRLPRFVDHRTARTRRDLSAALRSTGISTVADRRRQKSTAADDRELATLRRSIRSHPVHSRPDRDELGRVGERYSKLVRDTEAMRREVSATTNSLARSFDRILALLVERDYITSGKTPVVTEHGARLGRIYSESDLLVAECLRQHLWRGLAPAELAAVVSAVVFESRQEGDATPHGPTGPIRHALGETVRVWTELRADEVRHKLPPTREPDVGFVTAVHRWASNHSLVDALIAAGDNGKALSGGDFVRWCRQVIDLLDQVRLASPDPEISQTASKAVKALRRGVVAIDAA